jgi:hypothetical protein
MEGVDLTERTEWSHPGQGQDGLLDVGSQFQQVHDLGDPGSGQALTLGDLGSDGDVAGVQEVLKVAGPVEKGDDAGAGFWLSFPTLAVGIQVDDEGTVGVLLTEVQRELAVLVKLADRTSAATQP